MIVLIACLLFQAPRTRSIVLGGDIMLNGISVKQKPLAKLAPILRPASATLMNLEIPLTNTTRQTPNKSAADVSARRQYILQADPAHAPLIAASGVRMVTLGNNHCMDYRAAGMRQMMSALRKSGILFAGAGENRMEALAPAVYADPGGTRIGLISALAFVGDAALGHCTPARKDAPGIATFRFGGKIDDKAKTELSEMFGKAKQSCDLLIVGLHWGIERQSVPTAYQVQLGRACIDAGANVVWGNHPHVLQGAELYKGKPILYSMGNLISSKGGPAGLIKLVYADGGFSRAQFFPLRIETGRVAPLTSSIAKTAVQSFKDLCARLERLYPSKNACSLFPPNRPIQPHTK